MTKRKSKAPASKPTQSTQPKAPGGSRSRTLERRAERQKQKRRQQQTAIAIGLALFAVVVVIVFIIVNQPASAPIPEGTLDRYEGIPQSRTEDGFPILGNPNAPVRVEDFSSFSCPGCAAFQEQWHDEILEQVRAGVISFTYVPLTLGSLPNAAGAAQSALCAGEQGAFFEMHDTLFHWHRTFGNQAFSQNRLVSGIENLGLNESQYNDCIGSARVEDVMTTAQTVANARPVTATPTIFINGVQWAQAGDLVEAIQSALATTGLTPVPLGGESPEATDEVDVTPEVEATADVEETTEPDAAEATEDSSVITEDVEPTVEATPETEDD